jgi:hypothetical protein
MIQYIGRCDSFDETASEINNSTFRRIIGTKIYKDFEIKLGYGSFLQLAKDYHVRYYKGKWRNKKAVCCMWSAYHHIWVITND